MSGGGGRALPPVASRFQKGHSGNPKGRPRATKPVTSAFDIVMERTLTVMQAGKPRELTVEEALQHRTYEDALKGNRSARREILKMIAKREKWLAAKAPTHKPVEVKSECGDPENANDALVILGIAERQPQLGHDDQYDRLLLLPWAVQIALSRRGRKSLTDQDVSDIKRCTRDHATLRWPGSLKG